MAIDEDHENPLVVVLRPFPFTSSSETQFSKRFRFLEAWDLPMQARHLLLIKHAQSARALICGSSSQVPYETLKCLPNLGCVLCTSTGVDHIDLNECKRRGIIVANAGPVCSDDVADFAVGLLIDVLRRISSSDRLLRAGIWPHKPEFRLGSKLGGKRVGIVGLGSIGSEVANRLEASKCIISYNSRKKKPYVPFPYYSNVLDLAANNDVLVICCELNKDTFHIINEDVMSALGKKGVIINVGRGALIDEKELVRRLVDGELGGAGLDVFEHEPNVPKELLGLDNVVLSPHKGVLTPESYSALDAHTMANLEAFFSKKPLSCLIKNVQTTTSNTHWTPPPVGFIKLNVDGACSEGKIAAGVIARDHLGGFVACAAKNLDFGAPISAEANAFLLSISLIQELNLSNIIIEGDAKLMVDWINNPLSTCDWRVQNIVQQCREFLQQRSDISCQFSSRVTNGVAHALAQFSITHCVTNIWSEGLPPPQLLDPIFADLAFIVTPPFQ